MLTATRHAPADRLGLEEGNGPVGSFSNKTDTHSDNGELSEKRNFARVKPNIKERNGIMKPLVIGGHEAALPIVQGGMGVGISLHGLASAVANEGGIGVISSAGMALLHPEARGNYEQRSIEGLRTEIRRARAATRGVIGVNIMVALTNYADMVRTAIEEGADIIFSGAGLPLNLPTFLTPGCTTRLAPIVSSGRAAQIICEKWLTTYHYLPDALVVEGPMAGGHLGFKPAQITDPRYALERILPEVVAVARCYCKPIPVVAAGGIRTGADMARLLRLGASAVQLGSAFVPTAECDASTAFKEVYVRSRRDDLRIIQSPVGMPGRAFDSEFLHRVDAGLERPTACPYHCIKTCNWQRSPYCIMKALYQAARGNLKKGFAFAGGNAYLADKISTVREVVARLTDEFRLATAPTLVRFPA